MALASRRRGRNIEAWPGYVDVLSTLLMVIVFVLMIFVVAQLYLSQALTGKDQTLAKLSQQLNELSEMLSMERGNSQQLKVQLSQLSSALTKSTAERDALQNRLTVVIGERDSLKAQLGDANSQIAASKEKQKELEDAYKTIDADKNKITALLNDIAALESLRDDLQNKLLTADENAKQITSQSEAQVALLNQQILAMREQLAQLAATLDASEQKSKEQQVQIADLGSKLNAALASKVEELARYRSEFFGRLREALGQRDDIRIVGDRFVFQSEVLFASGSADIGDAGRDQLDTLATTLILITKEIPNDIDWVLRIDGHTDKRPITSGLYPSNWELSTARAISVLKYLASKGIPENRMAAAGFAEYSPLDPGDSEEALTKNRRIEFKLDQR
ncbi:peptidoglycan -binding protein [Dongia sedimenti]|uniref:Peptidoglycan -binding protein n=1 Tax=Dongia sedimenti TaxID=3064282 RepID=A0ABU0YFG6_9PROT|nr:peptidoglycan -binding protein [Rhodospirillaceae bacterium R-7]